MKVAVGQGELEIVQGDITQVPVDAVVNAANEGLRGGGGVDGAIHRAGGPRIMEECRRIGHCPTGRAVVTTAGHLPARWVVHAVGPVWAGGARGERDLLESAYRDSLRRAEEQGAASVAFPAISAGVYGYPLEDAAEIALRTGVEYLRAGGPVRRLVYVLFAADAWHVYQEALAKLLREEPSAEHGGGERNDQLGA